MANRKLPRAWIDSEGLLDLMKQLNVSIRELSRRERIGYSERQLRWMLKQNRTTLDVIMRICEELGLVFATRPMTTGAPYVTFFINDPDDICERMNHNTLGFTFWTPVSDPSGFDYPAPIAR